MACFLALSRNYLTGKSPSHKGFPHGYNRFLGLIFALWLPSISLYTPPFYSPSEKNNFSAFCHYSLRQFLHCWIKMRPRSPEQSHPHCHVEVHWIEAADILQNRVGSEITGCREADNQLLGLAWFSFI